MLDFKKETLNMAGLIWQCIHKTNGESVIYWLIKHPLFVHTYAQHIMDTHPSWRSAQSPHLPQACCFLDVPERSPLQTAARASLLVLLFQAPGSSQTSAGCRRDKQHQKLLVIHRFTGLCTCSSTLTLLLSGYNQ